MTGKLREMSDRDFDDMMAKADSIVDELAYTLSPDELIMVAVRIAKLFDKEVRAPEAGKGAGRIVGSFTNTSRAISNRAADFFVRQEQAQYLRRTGARNVPERETDELIDTGIWLFSDANETTVRDHVRTKRYASFELGELFTDEFLTSLKSQIQWINSLRD